MILQRSQIRAAGLVVQTQAEELVVQIQAAVLVVQIQAAVLAAQIRLAALAVQTSQTPVAAPVVLQCQIQRLEEATTSQIRQRAAVPKVLLQEAEKAKGKEIVEAEGRDGTGGDTAKEKAEEGEEVGEEDRVVVLGNSGRNSV